MKEIIDWPIKPYNKCILAMAYFPELEDNLSSALRRLSRWIKNNKPLTEALLSTGYLPHQRSFTARQTALIFEYLGEP